MVVLYPLLRYAVFGGKLIPKKLDSPKIDAKSALKDPFGGIFGAVLFIVVIILLIVLSALHMLEGVQGVWSITAPAGIIMLLRDIGYDLWVRKKDATSAAQEKRVEGKEQLGKTRASDPEEPKAGGQTAAGQSEKNRADPASCPENETETASPTPTAPPRKLTLLQKLKKTLPTPYTVISRLPLALLPFAFSMFILVEALQYTGWISVFAGWWGAWVNVGGVAGAVWLMGTIGVLGCNIFGTNIGATVLLSSEL